MHGLVDEMSRARMPWLNSQLRSWYDDARLARQTAAWLDPEALHVDDVEFGTWLRDEVGLHIGVPMDYANRRIELTSGGWAVTGIRFRGGDVTCPFVDVIATSEAPTPAGLAEVAHSVVPVYQPFSPLCLRVEAPDPIVLVANLVDDARFGDGCKVDMLLVAGLVESLLRVPRVPAYSRIELRPGTPAALAERARTIYNELARRQPDVTWWANPEDIESLATSEAEGLLFEVLVEGDSAGVVAAARDDGHGMTGFSVRELCLAASHRGRRLAAGVLQRLVDRLPATRGDVLWGTIHPDNTASRRNSLSIGRQQVGGYAWITPAGLPGMRRPSDH